MAHSFNIPKFGICRKNTNSKFVHTEKYLENLIDFLLANQTFFRGWSALGEFGHWNLEETNMLSLILL